MSCGDAGLDMRHDHVEDDCGDVLGVRGDRERSAAQRGSVAGHVGGSGREVRMQAVEALAFDAIGDKTEAAYARGDLFDKRRRLMDAWAEFCGEPSGASGDVVSLRSTDRAG